MIAGIVLAAGLARRMGRQKLLLQLQGKALVRWAVERMTRRLAGVLPAARAEAALRLATEVADEDVEATVSGERVFEAGAKPRDLLLAADENARSG